MQPCLSVIHAEQMHFVESWLSKNSSLPVVGEHGSQAISIHYTLEKCYRKMSFYRKTDDCFFCTKISELHVSKGQGNDEVLTQETVSEKVNSA